MSNGSDQFPLDEAQIISTWMGAVSFGERDRLRLPFSAMIECKLKGKSWPGQSRDVMDLFA